MARIKIHSTWNEWKTSWARKKKREIERDQNVCARSTNYESVKIRNMFRKLSMALVNYVRSLHISTTYLDKQSSPNEIGNEREKESSELKPKSPSYQRDRLRALANTNYVLRRFYFGFLQLINCLCFLIVTLWTPFHFIITDCLFHRNFDAVGSDNSNLILKLDLVHVFSFPLGTTGKKKFN